MIYERSAKIGTAHTPASIAETNPNLVSMSGGQTMEVGMGARFPILSESSLADPVPPE